MGIRFRCPNGHKLNVKTFQAKMRGVCPYCGAKFTVPAESTEPPSDKTGPDKTGNAEQTDAIGETGQPTPQPAGQETPNPQPAPSQPTRGKKNAPNPLAEDPQALWYVRPPSGGQFGPADGNVMRDWIKDGRITADSLVWREGWQDWAQAVTIFPRLALVRFPQDDDAATKPPPPPPPSLSPSSKKQQSETPPQAPLPQEETREEQSPLEPPVESFVQTDSDVQRHATKSPLARRGRRRPRSARDIKDRRVTAVVGLSVLLVAMAAALVWVLMR